MKFYNIIFITLFVFSSTYIQSQSFDKEVTPQKNISLENQISFNPYFLQDNTFFNNTDSLYPISSTLSIEKKSKPKKESLLKRGEVIFFLALPFIVLGYSGVLLVNYLAATQDTSFRFLGLEAIVGASLSAVLLSGIVVYIDRKNVEKFESSKKEDLVYYFAFIKKL